METICSLNPLRQSPMSVQIVHSLADDAWDSFVTCHPKGTIYHTREMFEVWSKANEYRPRLWAYVSGDNILAFLIPVEISFANGFLRPFTTRSISFGSLLYTAGSDRVTAIRELLQAYTRESNGASLFTELRNPTNLSEIQPILQENSFAFESHLNYLIDLTLPMEKVWKGLSKSTQKHIRTAQKNKLVAENVTDQSQLPLVYNLLKTTYHRIRIPLPSRTFFQAAFHILIPKGMLKVNLVRYDGIPISTRLALVYKDRILDWYTGSDRSFEKLYPEEFLIWETLLWGMVNGYRIFDFGGAGRPSENYGPRVFKERFGGGLVDFGRNTFVHSPIRLRISKFAYGLYRKGLKFPIRALHRSDMAALPVKV